jgi:serine/threonine protein kinase
VISSALDYKRFLDRRKQLIQEQVECAQTACAANGPQQQQAQGTLQSQEPPALRHETPETYSTTAVTAKAAHPAAGRGAGWNLGDSGPVKASHLIQTTVSSGADTSATYARLAAEATPQRTANFDLTRYIANSGHNERPPSAGRSSSLPVGGARQACRSLGRRGNDSSDGLLNDTGDDSQLPSKGVASSGASSVDDYSIGKQIGQGAYATVVFGLHKESNQKVAIKVYDKYKLLDPQRRRSVRNEIRLMERFRHPNIVAFHEAIDSAKHIHIIMEYIGGGSLHHMLKKRPGRKLEDYSAKRIFYQLCQGIRYLHERQVCHRDIKLENMILEDVGSTHPDEFGPVKIIDFGFSTIVTPGKKLKVFCGTPSYMAPEIVARKEYPGFCADIWAMGVLLYALLCGSFPFRGQNDRDLYRKIVRGVFHVPEHVTDGARHQLLRMLTADMTRRPTLQETLADAWLANHRDELYAVAAAAAKVKQEKPGCYQPNTSTHSTATTAAPSSEGGANATSGSGAAARSLASVGSARRTQVSSEDGASCRPERLASAPNNIERSSPRQQQHDSAAESDSTAPRLAAASNPCAGSHCVEVAPDDSGSASIDGAGKAPVGCSQSMKEEALSKLERLGYPREEILSQLEDESSHLFKLYNRFLKALSAWDAKK